jgi:hypothetical protein
MASADKNLGPTIKQAQSLARVVSVFWSSHHPYPYPHTPTVDLPDTHPPTNDMSKRNACQPKRRASLSTFSLRDLLRDLPSEEADDMSAEDYDVSPCSGNISAAQRRASKRPTSTKWATKPAAKRATTKAVKRVPTPSNWAEMLAADMPSETESDDSEYFPSSTSEGDCSCSGESKHDTEEDDDNEEEEDEEMSEASEEIGSVDTACSNDGDEEDDDEDEEDDDMDGFIVSNSDHYENTHTQTRKPSTVPHITFGQRPKMSSALQVRPNGVIANILRGSQQRP